MSSILEDRIAALSPYELQELATRLLAKRVRSAEARIHRTTRGPSAPLSFAQERLWLIEQCDSVGSAYHYPVAMSLDGFIDAVALERSFSELVRRHESLRTRIVTDARGRASQVIDPPSAMNLERIDISMLEEADKDAEMQRIIRADTLRPFDLARGPLFRVALVKRGEQAHVLLLTMHHIIVDGWSLSLLIKELTTTYTGFLKNRASSLPELEVQYADYAIWQREWLQGKLLEGQLSYWKERLAGAPAALELPTDRTRPAVPSYKGGSLRFALSPSLSSSLRELSRREGVTLYMILLAAFQALLSRWSGQDDIVVGSPIAGRTHRQTEGLVGFFVNMLVMRTDLSGDPTFRELLGRVKEVALGAYAHQDLPFGKLVAELQPERDLSQQALFQVAFTLQDISVASIELPQLTLKLLDTPNETAKFDLAVDVFEAATGLIGRVEFATDLFDESTIERLVEGFQRLLEGVAGDADQRVSQLALLSDAQREQLLYGWNSTAAEYPKDKCIQQLFEEQAQKNPDAIALVYEDQRLTYGELEERSNRLAHHLQSQGVGPEVVVGLCVERSLEMVIGLLGILKAGGAYLPLDPSYPRERLEYMLSDAHAAIVLTMSSCIDVLEGSEATRICLDQEPQIARCPSSIPQCATTAQNLAYVIYTSGSTGMPKGVTVSHGNIMRLVKGVDYATLDERSAVLQIATLSFDAATFELWGPLLNGGRAIIATRDVALSPEELAKTLTSHKVKQLFLTTSLFNRLAADTPGIFTGLDEVLFGGEAVDVSAVRAILAAGPPRRLKHVYGPTESTTFATAFTVSGLPECSSTVPIGRPISNTQVYVLDESFEPVPVGVIGELYIGGDGLARGYLNQAGLTAQRFVADPFGQEGKRLYRTGDLVRYRADGNLQFIGRRDHQVKIRGFRIELGEIEAALLLHPQVAQAVVIARQESATEKRLVGYVVAKEGVVGDVSELRAHLKRTLPDYMVPAAFVFLHSLPLTGSGKLDRKALPAPDLSEQNKDQYVAARTPTEEVLVQIWAEVLKIDQVGIDDNFFELGGHSLLATQVIALVQQSLGIYLPMSKVFEMNRIRSLGEYVDVIQSVQLSDNSESPNMEEQFDEGCV